MADESNNEDDIKWQPEFDPDEFTKENQPLSIERFEMKNDKLKEWAVRLSKLRA